MNDCLFCNIIHGSESSSKIYEDEHTYAFLDIYPTNPGHTLVVPKKHSVNLYDTDEDIWCEIMKTIKKLAPVVKETMEADGINIIMNNGPAAGQIIDHAHVHIVPRMDDDGFRHWKGAPYKEGEVEAVAEKIKAAL